MKSREAGAGPGLTLVFAGAVGLLLHQLDAHYPVRQWLFWKYLGYWALALLGSFSWLVAGHALLTRAGYPRYPLREHLLMSLAVGLLVFTTGMFLAGTAGLYSPAFAILWPLILLASGQREGLGFGRRAFRHIRRVRRGPVPRPSLVRQLATGYGIFGLCAVYFFILSPENTAFDARWYHLGLAEQYAIAGGIRPFAEGWYQSAIPHLASHLYTWPFLLPGMSLFDRVELCAHLEFVLFLATLFAVPVLVERLVPGIRARGAWVAVFLFPGIFLYDSTLSGAADHIAAFWAIPIHLALLRTWEGLDGRRVVLLGLMLAAASMTKYQSASIVFFPALALFHRIGWKPSRYWWIAGVTGVLATAPHWLKNWVWYGDPLYPFLHRWLPARPWIPDAEVFTVVFTDQLWKPTGTFLERVGETLTALATFSFVPHDWWGFHRDVPVFGFLFTLSVLALPFLRRHRRLLGLYLATHVGIFTWYWISHQDRYLQILLPWMAAATATTLVLAWRSGSRVQVPLSALVVLQVVWGGDVFFFDTHAMNRAPIHTVSRLLSSGFRKDDGPRNRIFLPFSEFAGQVPAGGRVLVHEQHNVAGIGAPVTHDWPGYQGAISYARQGSPRELHGLLRGLGITHVLWCQRFSQGYDHLAGDLKFHYFVEKHTKPIARYGDLVLAALGEEPAADEAFPHRVGYVGAGARYDAGLYFLDDLTVPQYGTHAKSEYPSPVARLPEVTFAQADFLVRERADLEETAPEGFQELARTQYLVMYQRAPAAP